MPSYNCTIQSIKSSYIRFPTSLEHHGSDAMHPDPDYSCAYVVVSTDDGHSGHGFTFTLGRGTEIVIEAIKLFKPLVVGKKLQNILDNFSGFCKSLTRESQIMWLGPEKGVVHMAVAAVVNAIWDLWGKLEGKPVWKLVTDMTPEQLVSVIDFTYITDVITKEEAIEMLKKNYKTRHIREAEMLAKGYPAYCTTIGWMGYPTEKVKALCAEYIAKGFSKFKVKVGISIEEDRQRLTVVRDAIGYNNTMMVDANQCWDVPQAIEWMKQLAEFKPLWIEEPTSPDDALGHATIAKALKPYGIGVATGENCCNRVIFKQLLQLDGLQFCQIDSCRLAGVNEVLAVLLMAAKLNVPVCPHAGGVGLCELVQHLSIIDYIYISGTLENRVTEFADHLHEHFKTPVLLKNGHYIPPTVPGYTSEMLEESLRDYEYPNGREWQKLFQKGLYPYPTA